MMDAALRAFVRERAGRRCEYCRLREDDDDFLAFHVDHVIAKQHGGIDDPATLCWACAECNWAKGSNLAGLLGGKLYPLFNPRKQSWTRHFRWEQKRLAEMRNVSDSSRQRRDSPAPCNGPRPQAPDREDRATVSAGQHEQHSLGSPLCAPGTHSALRPPAPGCRPNIG